MTLEPDSLPAVDLDGSRRIHVVGVGGAGMSAIASVLAAMGHRVSGSDLKSSPALERLRTGGLDVHVGHDASQALEVDLVTLSSAISPSNPEVVAAVAAGIPVVSRAAVLRAICARRRTVAVSGTHGKTTTSSMLSLILVEAGWRPSYLVGGDLNETGTNAVWDEGEWLVVEADESDGTFVALDPEVAVVTNVEPDHLDFYGTFDAVVAAFDRFCAGRPGGVVAGADDPVALGLARRHGGVGAGAVPDADFRIARLAHGPAGVRFDLERRGAVLGEVVVPVLGACIARNAAVAVTAALTLGVPFERATAALARFAGVARRFEWRGERDGIRFVDDYAHLPSEVAAAVDAATVTGAGRVVAVFQPHRHSRTATLGVDFADSFRKADVVVITDIYAAGEEPIPGVSGRTVHDAVAAAHPDIELHYAPTRPALKAVLWSLLRAGDLCLTLGAGDLTTLPTEMIEGIP